MAALKFLGDALSRSRWEGSRQFRRVFRCVGRSGVLIGLCVVTGSVSVYVAHWCTHERSRLQFAASASGAFHNAAIIKVAGQDDLSLNRSRLQVFEQILILPDDVSTAVQDVFSLAEKEGLTLARGTYKSQLEMAGGFTRHRFSLPVSGDAKAVQRWIGHALAAQRALTLEQLQIKRETGVAGAGVEAHVHWVLFVRTPESSGLQAASKPLGTTDSKEVP